MNIGQLDGQPLALQIFNGMTAESTCVNERWAKDQLFRCVCFAGGRHQTILDETVGPIFQSTSSVWRTTAGHGSQNGTLQDFNPRPPCGGRLWGDSMIMRWYTFQSTSSVWRTTNDRCAAVWISPISIHVLRVEDDIQSCWYNGFLLYFNPRPPCGGRPVIRDSHISANEFQSTSSVWRTTRHITAYLNCSLFQSTSSVWRTTQHPLV